MRENARESSNCRAAIVTTSLRQPTACIHRSAIPTGAEGISTCGLAMKLCSAFSAVAPQVSQDICEACCQHPLPTGPQLNPVVASLVCNAVRSATESGDTSAASQVAREHARLFASTWLKQLDNCQQPSLSAHREDSPTDTLARTADFDQESHGAAGERAHAIGERMPWRDMQRGARYRIQGNRAPNIGLVGPCEGYGLAQQSLDIARHLGVNRWLVPHDLNGDRPELPCRIDAVSRPLSSIELEAWLSGLDAVLFIERPTYPLLTQVARRLGVCVVCVPNWEWIHPGLDWLSDVDVMLCPTLVTANMLRRWQACFGFTWQLVHIPWPIETSRFRFRMRRKCRAFVYVHGLGGATARRFNGHETIRRKGLHVLLDAARRMPSVPIIVYAAGSDQAVPPNVELRYPPADNRLLYLEGDVCVQPSHWEGLGLPLLECQAAGMPLITTDAPPMNEHQPLRAVQCELHAFRLASDLVIPVALMEPQRLAEALASVFETDLKDASKRARRFVQREHSWQTAGPKLRHIIRHACMSMS